MPIASSKAPQINVPLRHQGPNFPFSSSGHLAPHSFSKMLLYQGFPISLLRYQRVLKDLKLSTAPSRAPNFLIMSSKWWPLISHHVIKGSQFIIASSKGPIVTSNFPSRYQEAPFIIASSRGPHWFPPSRYQMDPNLQNTSWDMYWLKKCCRPI